MKQIYLFASLFLAVSLGVQAQYTGGIGSGYAMAVSGCYVSPPVASYNQPACAGSPIQLNASEITGASYQWSGPDGFTSTEQNPLVDPGLAGEYRVKAILGCGESAEAIINVILQDPSPVSVELFASPGTTVCFDTEVTFLANAQGAGSTPTYTWYINEVMVPGVTGNNLGARTFTDGDEIYVELYSSEQCPAAFPAISPTVTMTVTSVEVSVSIIADPNESVCPDASITLTASSETSGASPQWQWYKNGSIIVGATNPVYIVNNPVDGDQYRVWMQSSLTNCILGDNFANSPVHTLAVITPPVANAGSDQTIPYNSSTTINAVVGGTGSYDYSWTPADKLIDALIQNPQTINLTETTVFTLTVTDLTSLCTNTATVTVNVMPETFALSLDVNPSEGGSVNTDAAGDYPAGAQIALTATPATGYAFTNWTRGATIVSTDPNFSYTMPGEDVTLTANFELAEYALSLLVSPPGSGTVNIEAQKSYYYGTEIPLVATANTGYSFIHWTRGATVISTEAAFTYTMPEGNVVLTAHFALIPKYTLNLAVNPTEGGSVNVAAEGDYFEAEIIALTATPNTGYAFVNWTRGTDIVSTDAAFNFSMPAENVTLTANFALIPKYTLNLTVNPTEGGSVNVAAEGDYYEAEMIALTATPNTGYVFVNWTRGTDIVSTDAAFNFSMPAENVTLTANFALIPKYTLNLTVNPTEGGSVNVAAEGDYFEAEIIALTATPNTGYAFVNWTRGTDIVSTDAAFNFSMPAENVTLTANFAEEAPQEFTLIVNSTPENSGTVVVSVDDVAATAPYTFPAGTTLVLTATAAEGFEFVHWLLEDMTEITVNPYTFNIAQNLQITAVFSVPGLVPDVANMHHLKLYPNPTRDQLWVESPLLQNPAQIYIYNSKGTQVEMKQVADGTGKQLIPLSNYAKGLYILKIISPQGSISRTFMVQ